LISGFITLSYIIGLASRTKDISVKKSSAKASQPAATKVAIITGGARGIGLAIGQHFLAKGYNVALLDIDKKTLAKTKATLNSSSVLTLACDVSKPEQVKEAISKVAAAFGRIDALVNNAGVAIFKPILEVSWKDWRSVMDTNLDGAFLCTQACAKVMLKTGGGAVVNIASISGLRASTLRVAYGTSKGALIHLTKQQAAELGDVGIRVNCVAPGPVLTEMAKLVHSTSIIKDYFDAIPQNRYGTPEEIADAVVYLCSEQASFVNGQVLAVDGGFDATGVGLPNLRQTRETKKKASKTATKATK
jgi:meso-butanediol dehydrogenase / (S,S)-butanediol dehydrogenase / diacetyl reductase